jgi:hypothetical protein
MAWHTLTARLVRYYEAKRLAVMELEDATLLKLEDPGREYHHLEGSAGRALVEGHRLVNFEPFSPSH